MQLAATRRCSRRIAALIGLAFAGAISAEAAPADLEGTWTASAAEREGQRADEVVGHRLALRDNRFQIDSKDGKPLYAGTFQINPRAAPATIDFEHTQGALNGKLWKGIYRVNKETLTICDNAADPEKARPTAFEATAGSGSVLLTFQRASP
jgi:uncharacterized protein (TIGR03067 family)